jgi:hypothetical protein
MSRYVCHFLVNLAPGAVRFPLQKLFEACGMETTYETDDYVMARELPGQVIFTKLVTAEVSIDITSYDPDAVRLTFLVKNEELPLNLNNHCRQIFDLLRMAIAHNYDWEAIDSLNPVSILPTPEPALELEQLESAPKPKTDLAPVREVAPTTSTPPTPLKISTTLNAIFN